MASISKSKFEIKLFAILLIAVVLAFPFNKAQAACATPAASVGALDFQGGVFKYCNGTSWLPVGTIDASLLTTGTLADARLSANVAMRNAANTFTTGGHIITNDAVATKPLVIRAIAAQTAPLQEWQTSASAVLYGLDISGVPVATTDLVTKSYVTTSVGNYVLKAGDTMTGALVNNTNSASTALAITQAGAGYAATFMGGNVGIGTTAPNILGTGGRVTTIYGGNGNLELASNAADAAGTTSGRVLYAFDSNSANHKIISSIESITEGATANQRGGVLQFLTKPNASTTNTERVRIDSAGRVGIGTTNPGTKLEVAGTIRVGDGAETCGASYTGGIRYNGGFIQFCNGTAWTTLAAGSSGVSFPSSDTTAGNSIAIGTGALGAQPNSAAYQNIAVGAGALAGALTTAATHNLAIGYKTLNANTSGTTNVAVGTPDGFSGYPLGLNTTGNNNTAVGPGAPGGANTTGSSNTFVGFSAGWSSSTTNDNTYIGTYSGLYSTGSGNAAIGASSLAYASGGYNAALGQQALFRVSTGNWNVGVGSGAGSNVTTGGLNTLLGAAAGNTNPTTGSGNILISGTVNVDTPAAGTNDFLDIGNVIFATGMTGTLAAPAGNVGIGTTNPTATLDVNGRAKFRSGINAAVRVITAAGAVTVTTSDYLVCVKKTTGAATAVNLPASPATGDLYVIKDCKGDSATNNITLTPAAGTIDGAATSVINANRASVGVFYDGTEWQVF